MQETVLELKNYSVSFDTPDGEVQAVRNVDLTVKKEKYFVSQVSPDVENRYVPQCDEASATECTCKSGEISLCGENITAYKRKKWKSCAEVR